MHYILHFILHHTAHHTAHHTVHHLSPQAYEAVDQEYSMLLAGQLEAQRAHYEAIQSTGLAELRASLEASVARRGPSPQPQPSPSPQLWP